MAREPNRHFSSSLIKDFGHLFKRLLELIAGMHNRAVLPLACLAFVLPAIQVGEQTSAPIHPLTVHRLNAASIRRFVVSNGAGKDAALAFTLSAAQPIIANRASLSCLNCSNRPDYPSIEFDPTFGDNYKGSEYRQASLNLRGLTPGGQYLVIFNMTCENLGAYVECGTTSKKETALEGDVNLPCLFKATSDHESLTLQFFRDHASKVGWTSLSSVDVHQVS